MFLFADHMAVELFGREFCPKGPSSTLAPSPRSG